jgi:membrane-associated protease RseP (regulator of RpoE activity)
VTGLTGLQPPPPAAPPVGAAVPADGGGEGSGGDVVRSNPLRLLIVVALLAALGIFVGVPVLVLVLALILSIFLHEVGHFVAARRSGMLVTEFFIGMGPRIWSFRRGEVEYGLKLFPLGAYVRIVGMSNLEQVEPELEDRTYRSKNYPRRLVTVIAGPAVNIGIGIVLFFALFLTTGYSSPQQWSVGRVVDGGAAEAAGLEAGDRVVSVNGESTGSWDEFTDQLNDRAGQEVVLGVERDGEQFETATRLGWALAEPGVAALPTDPTLPQGARVLSVDGEPVGDYAEFVAMLGASGTAVVDFEVGSGTYRARLPLPVALPADGARGFLGVAQGDADPETVGFVGAGVRAVGMVGEIGGSMVDFLGRLFSPSGLSRYAQMLTGSTDEATPTGDLVPLQSLDGSAPVTAPSGVTSQEDAEIRPLSLIGIVQVGDQLSGVSGFESVLFLLAMVNIFLGLVNLLPLLPFDGGHATVATYEAIRGGIARRPYRVDLAKLMPVTYVVVFILLGIGLSAMYLDIVDPVRIVP